MCECLRSKTTDQKERERETEKEGKRVRDRVDFIIKRLTRLPRCPFASRTKTLETRRRLSASTRNTQLQFGVASRRARFSCVSRVVDTVNPRGH